MAKIEDYPITVSGAVYEVNCSTWATLTAGQIIELLEKTGVYCENTKAPEEPKFKKFKMDNLDKTISELTGEGTRELVIRQGEALELSNKLAIQIRGNIDAPSRFTAERDTDVKTSHCYYSVSQGEIILTVNEQEPYDRHQIVGQLMVSQKFKDLQINEDFSYRPQQLATKLKFLRNLFPSKEQHMKICATLKNFEAKIARHVEETKTDKGDYHTLRTQAVDSNIPEAFKMEMPLIEGEEEVNFTVNTVVEAHGTEIKCFLESVDAAELIEEAFKTRVLEEVEKLKGKTTLIAR